MQQDQLIPLTDSNPYFQYHLASWRNPRWRRELTSRSQRRRRGDLEGRGCLPMLPRVPALSKGWWPYACQVGCRSTVRQDGEDRRLLDKLSRWKRPRSWLGRCPLLRHSRDICAKHSHTESLSGTVCRQRVPAQWTVAKGFVASRVGARDATHRLSISPPTPKLLPDNLCTGSILLQHRHFEFTFLDRGGRFPSLFSTSRSPTMPSMTVQASSILTRADGFIFGMTPMTSGQGNLHPLRAKRCRCLRAKDNVRFMSSDPPYMTVHFMASTSPTTSFLLTSCHLIPSIMFGVG